MRGDDAITRFLIGGGIPSLLALAFVVLIVLSFLLPLIGILNLLLYPVGFVIGLFLTGYYVRVVRSTYAGEEEPPAFGDWTELLTDGGYCVVIELVYSIPLIVAGVVATVIFAVVIGGGTAMGGSNTESMFAALGTASLLVFGVLLLLAMLYGLVASYLYPISMCIYADTEDLRACFSKERLTAVAMTGDYAIPWLIQAGILFGVQMFVGTLTIILIGYLLYPFLPFAVFFVSTAAFYMFAKAYDGIANAGRSGGDGNTRSTV